MSIIDHDKRDKTIREYIALKKKLRDRNEAERSAGLSQRRDLQEQFEPITSAQREVTEAIREHLKPIKQQLDNLPITVIKEEELPRKRRKIVNNDGPLTSEFKAKLLSGDKEVDTSFGIRFLVDGQPVIANKRINLDGDDIIIGSEVFEGTPGLWSLLTDARPRGWTEDDMEKYEDILEDTSVLHQDFDPDNNKPRSSGSWKWKNVLAPIWEKRVVEGSGLVLPRRCRVYIQNNGHACSVQKRGNGLFLRPRTPIVKRDGIFIKTGRTIYDGSGFTLPPILKIIINKRI